MKKFSVIFLLAFATVVFAQQSADCDCFNSWSTRTIGRRVAGDRLLFREARSVNFTSPVEHSIRFSYSNANITQWSLGVENYNWISHPSFPYWNPNFNVEVGVSNSGYFEAVLTAFGFQVDNVPSQVTGKTEGQEITTIYNPEKN